MSKAFAVYRVSQNLCIKNDEERVNSESDVETVSLMSLPYFNDNYFNESAEIIRGLAVTSEIKTTVCLTFSFRYDDKGDKYKSLYTLMCSEDVGRERDEAMIKTTSLTVCIP